ncbi:sensor histidine kinase, partial [Aquipuribacter hungaricus]
RWAVPLAATGVLVSFALPAVVAGYVRTRARLVAALRERAELAEREREAATREAVQRERTAMARELHDIAAHHISGIVLSAQAASALLRTDPARAGGYVVTVREEAQRTLAGLRQAVGLLREQGPGETAPVPDLEHLPALVASVRETGADVDLRVEGDPVPLGPLAGTAAYRMVQESLTNARAHALGAPVEVVVRHHPAGVELTVTNVVAGAGAGGAGAGGGAPTPARSGGGGHGLIGMRERATLLGGDL